MQREAETAELGETAYRNLLDKLKRSTPRPGSPPELAALCSCSLSELYQLTCRHAQLTPEAFLRRERVSAAQEMVRRTSYALEEIQFALGFTGSEGFCQDFLRLAGMTPQEYQDLGTSRPFTIQLPPGYRPREVLAYFARDPEKTMERVVGRSIYKAFAVEGGGAILSIDFEELSGRARCEIKADQALSPEDYVQAHQVAIRILGLGFDVAGFESRAFNEELVARLVLPRPGLTLALSATPFEALVWAIAGQQVNLAFAAALRRAVAELAGQPVSGTGLRLHPTPEQVADISPSALTARKFSRLKAEYLIGAAAAVSAGELDLAGFARESAVTAGEKLRAVRGLGPWTARYVLLRGLGFGDCAPVGDSGLNRGLQRFFQLAERPAVETEERLMETFAPHRSLATCHLWASLQEQ